MKMISSLAACGTVLVLLSQAASAETEMSPSSITSSAFGSTAGRPVTLYTLRNSNGMVAKVMNYGATITSLQVPDRTGRLDGVVLGFDSLSGYLAKEPYFGATVGRVGNRIAKGRFTLDGKAYQLATNDGPNHLHGGLRGFDKVVWDSEVVPGSADPAVRFRYLSRDGEEGYPGNCSVEVTFALTAANELHIDYSVSTDRDTPVNVTNHSYFNLKGPEHGDVLGHVLTLHASRYTPVDSTLIPTGELRAVAGTPMDFTQPATIGARILEVGGVPGGYDHNFVLDGLPGTMTWAARVYEPTTGRALEVLTTEPGVQFYSGNFLDGTITGDGGVVYRQHMGFCLETQHFPDSVNHPNFPSYVLKAGTTYTSHTVLRFSVRGD
jgi:aldose 1-epimerase